MFNSTYFHETIFWHIHLCNKCLLNTLPYYNCLFVNNIMHIQHIQYTANNVMWCYLQQLKLNCHAGPLKMDGSWWRDLTKPGPLEKGMASHVSILALRTPWTVWKGKNIWHWKMNSPGWQVPYNMLLENSGEITPERMKRWSQSENNTQLWMWLLIEASAVLIDTAPHKSDAVKSNIA